MVESGVVAVAETAGAAGGVSCQSATSVMLDVIGSERISS